MRTREFGFSRLAAIAAIGWLASCAAQAQPSGAALAVLQLTAGVHLITAEIAADDETRTTGLMFRHELAPNHGMLFIFDRPEKPCMWMRNTFVPLSVAFIAADGAIVNIEDMDPGTEQIHCARREVPYALEMARGWFAERGLRPGTTPIGGLPGVRDSGRK